jgi:DNA polymerase-3 subunit delta
MASPSSFARFQQALIRGRIEPIYLFEGEEEFFHEEGIRLLQAATLPEGAASVDREVIRGPESTLPQVLDAAATFPMVGDRRLIVVRDADGLRYDTVDDLKAYLANPNPKGCLIFSSTKFDKRRGLHRALQKGGTRVDCTRPGDAALVQWIRERLRGRGFGISDDLAEGIAAGFSGQGLARLDAELQKLMAAIGAPRPIQPNDLDILAGVPRLGDAFGIAKLMIRGERAAAIVAVRDLMREGEVPLLLLGGVSWYVRTALKARSASSRRIPPRETTSLYGIDPGRMERFNREVGRSTPEQLRRALALCLRTDRELKGGGAKDPAHALERLIHRVGLLAGRPA